LTKFHRKTAACATTDTVGL